MNIVDVFTKSITNDEIEHKYEYRITKSNIEIYNYGVNNDVQSYGIEIERKDILNGKTINLERDSVYNISPHRHKVQQLTKLLYDNEVSPINAIEILGDYVDEYIIDFDNVLKEISIG
ncbi:hypothetical protein CPAST_c27950 [Clostridium pasteurianum DSM 525 = ATCC 6013]|uniref:Uncharacterized protein n=1 Tax=Clostridium pasteurianum DSM 525 = ATCC 6013 TaxID=1262449 RepID=A0A0H3J6N1_CLOPA|nr:DUF6514 family protein [Clostridium pasteurianum]AJA48862.1 hypothetical protein CPAST_c27950 [Clostridium pasteurianum DSM 525 = ATCC 6013]AJA52850.1 hypothetical protein CLPA_c27950 [Clostridium pasteurianum DSM 525 = ATCC 6013]AOZ76074.1 hypothetical protein AQ983_13575 [Clostridium pasteurianum DSM 525 = ATCC 6013]AOZ79870.1 hypothetical protein AQ984_13570 [Clostridium pasteurianum]ELP60158.1 hypothetical protein F502_05962 [Clostridium pasteurianum DSM 525 = ATCC 6013]